MYKISTELGEFEGVDEKDARRQLRTAERAQRVKDRKAEKDREVARERAKLVAFPFLHRILSGESCPCGWKFYPHQNVWAPKAEIERALVGSAMYSTLERVDTKYGSVRMECIPQRFVGAVVNGECHHCLLFFEDSGEIVCYSLGVCDDQYALERLDGVEIEWFGVEVSW